MANRLRICFGSVIFSLVLFVLSTCRVGVGETCLADSDCEMGLLCLKRVMEIDNSRYEEHYGRCQRDQDNDGIANDGDGSGDETDYRCGVQVDISDDSFTQVVVEKVIGDCDDNCPDVANQNISMRFDCLAKDDCCPISDENKELAKRDQRCSEVTTEVDTCNACISDTVPATCYLSLTDGVDLDQSGCIHCRPLQNKVACTGQISQGKWTDTCSDQLIQGLLPKPACSGSWRCTGEVGTCKFTPELFNIKDDDGYNTLYQLDNDGDGFGDECDNCPQTPNGINCHLAEFAKHCDVNQDDAITEVELQTGNQKNRDGDEYGDACDRCPDKADRDNLDTDSDGFGNPCDTDDDGDGICDPQQTDSACIGSDNCPLVSNENQADLDQDGFGDLCDSDQDGDGIRDDGDGSGIAGDNTCRMGAKRNCDDNCPRTKNADQRDDNNNGVGDDCE